MKGCRRKRPPWHLERKCRLGAAGCRSARGKGRPDSLSASAGEARGLLGDRLRPAQLRRFSHMQLSYSVLALSSVKQHSDYDVTSQVAFPQENVLTADMSIPVCSIVIFFNLKEKHSKLHNYLAKCGYCDIVRCSLVIDKIMF